MGVALGCIHLRLDDFCRLTPEEFEAIYHAYREQSDADYKDAWERMRLHAAITIQPHIKNRMSAKRLLPFSWDNERPAMEKGGSAPQLTKEEQLQRFEKLAKRK